MTFDPLKMFPITWNMLELSVTSSSMSDAVRGDSRAWRLKQAWIPVTSWWSTALKLENGATASQPPVCTLRSFGLKFAS